MARRDDLELAHGATTKARENAVKQDRVQATNAIKSSGKAWISAPDGVYRRDNLPLYIFCGRFLLGAKLRPANIDGAAGAVDEVARIVARIRARWPKVRIVLRGDSGFCREELMAWCEAEGVAYLFGLAPNARLKAVLAPEAWEAARLCRTTGKAARLFRDFAYQTETSWSRPRRVVGKAEHLPDGANPRFVVTSLGREKIDARGLYEDLYCARGEMENRIKECQLDLFADLSLLLIPSGAETQVFWAQPATGFTGCADEAR